MLYHYMENGKRVYTLKEKIEGKVIEHSHPAHFTPEDKFSKYRILTKQKYNINPFDK